MTKIYLSGLEFTLKDAGIQPVFILAFRKSGSSVLNSIVRAVCDHNDVNYVDLGGMFFNHGKTFKEWSVQKGLEQLFLPGNVIGGVRAVSKPIVDLVETNNIPTLLLVRDPRDILVSEYFSNLVHSLPNVEGDAHSLQSRLREKSKELSIDEYCIEKADHLSNMFSIASNLIKLEHCHVIKYEDFVFNKCKFIFWFCEKFQLNVDQVVVDRILSWADVFPEQEQKNEFIRKVSPGDFEEKLSQSSKDALFSKLKKSLDTFGYL